MKYWNELEGSIFLSKVFSLPVEIGKIAISSLRVENDQPCIGIGFDISDFPDKLPEKWKNKGYNMCRLGITCNDIKNLKVFNIPAHEVFTVKINKKMDHFTFEATSDNAHIEFNAKFISLSGPTVYINDPDDYYFK
ncbi:Imm50 family immunity protein [Pseudomonas allii]|uniref:Imm50 family immunity protein n=2 Tax=Pseudomonas allii TaxID=2740531 RepID=A0ACC6L6N4_9PSED|nr:Imm50 family immunity protein [Pseudomonas allii]MDR9874079.1 Imm50 family immunity protein [Pseudomonas allii]NWN47966.1 hypothetical protein [Pseudomonas allii]NWN63976.1 hypothetical protein [Pseudomonas allii]